MAEHLDIKRELAGVDLRNYNFYSELTEGEQKSFSPYILMRYVSNAEGSRDLQEWFIEMTNELVNKDHWTLSKNHKALLWKLFAGVGVGNHIRHQYLKAGSKEKADKFEKFLCEIYPSMKLSDIKVLSKMMDKNDRNELFERMGFEKKQRKDYE